MRHFVLDSYIRLLVTQKQIVNNYLRANLDLKFKIERLLEKLDDPIQIGTGVKVETINLRNEIEETLSTINIDIETSTLEKQILDEKITSILST